MNPEEELDRWLKGDKTGYEIWLKENEHKFPKTLPIDCEKDLICKYFGEEERLFDGIIYDVDSIKINQLCENNNLRYEIVDRQNYLKLKNIECDLFINAAGSSDKPLSKKEPMFDFQSNVYEVSKSLLDFKFKKYILCSSCEVYPDCSNNKLTKENVDITIQEQSTYGFHKYLGELIVKHYALSWLIFRLGGMVGKGLRKNPIFDIVEGGKLFVDPSSEFQYLLTDDVAKIIFNIVDKKIENEIFNLCGSGIIKLEEIIGNNTLNVEDPSPILKYNVNLDKIKKIHDIPFSRETVLKFTSFYLNKKKNFE